MFLYQSFAKTVIKGTCLTINLDTKYIVLKTSFLKNKMIQQFDFLIFSFYLLWFGKWLFILTVHAYVPFYSFTYHFWCSTFRLSHHKKIWNDYGDYGSTDSLEMTGNKHEICRAIFNGLLSLDHFWKDHGSIPRASFSQTHNIGNNANIGIRGFTTWKQKKSTDKMLLQVRTEPMTSDSKSNTLLSELTWHVLLRGSLNFCSCTTWFLDFHDHWWI